MFNFFKKFTPVALLSLMIVGLYAESETESRVSLSLRFSPIKKVKVYLVPELRLDENGIDKALGEIEAKYSLLKVLDMGVAYKAVFNFKDSSETELAHRITVYSEAEHEIGRFTPALRVMYTNYNEDDGLSNFLRVRIKGAYNIRRSKIDPYAVAELYYGLENGTHKLRYGAGLNWRLKGSTAISFGYKIDDYINSDRIKHIIELGVGVKF